MPTLRQRVAGWFLRDEVAELDRARDVIHEMYLRGPVRFSPDDVVSALREIDSHTLANMIRDMDYVMLGGLGEPTEMDRQRAVAESRYLTRTCPMVEYSLSLWTSFGFGESVDLVPDDDEAAAVWEEFWHADRNVAVLGDRNLQNLSNQVLRDGERFLAMYVSKADGSCTIRSIDSLEVTERISAPGDLDTAVWYKREWTEYGPSDPTGRRMILYYPDFRAFLGEPPKDGADDAGNGAERLGPARGRSKPPPPDWKGYDAEGNEIDAASLLPAGALRADEVNPATFVCVIPVCHNAKESWRGWPLMVTGHSWAREHEQFRVNRANVAESTNAFTRELKVKAGSRGIDAVKRQIESSRVYSPDPVERNPPPVAGSTYITNEAAELRQLSQLTGAGDAKEDGQSLAWYTLLSARLFPHYAGMGDAYRLATATSMEGPILRTFSGYQRFWSSVWRDVARVVMLAAARYDGKHFEKWNASVTLDRLLETDVVQLSEVMSGFYANIFSPLLEAGMIPDEAVAPLVARTVHIMLQEMGVPDVDEIIDEEQVKAAMEQARAGREEQPEVTAPPPPPEEGDGNGARGQPQGSVEEMAAMFEAAQRVLMRG